tara:strand:- start:599 stop:1192 length:594 start_codon:yes stop_codon:yes gene_type:complete
MKIFFATGNSKKLEEARQYLEPLGHDVELLLIEGKPPDFIEPQTSELTEVALSKSDQAISMISDTELLDCAILVEDSGLFIDSLNGFPGVYSSYVFETIGLGGILKIMSEEENRHCEYRAVSVLVINGKRIITTGVCRGKLGNQISGQGGFGYDPIFIPNGSNEVSFGQMNESEKSSFSHRGESLKALSKAISPPSM